MNPHFWWYVARASGLVAWALLAASMAWGLYLATRALGKRPPAPWLLNLHRYLAALLLAFTGFHLGALVADSYTEFGLSDLFIPMVSGWKPGAVAWGIVALYGVLVVQITSIYMRRLAKRVWRWIHRGSYAVLAMVTVHAFAAGTDVNNPLVGWMIVVGLIGLGFPLTYRLLAPSRRRNRADRKHLTDGSPNRRLHDGRTAELVSRR